MTFQALYELCMTVNLLEIKRGQSTGNDSVAFWATTQFSSDLIRQQSGLVYPKKTGTDDHLTIVTQLLNNHKSQN